MDGVKGSKCEDVGVSEPRVKKFSFHAHCKGLLEKWLRNEAVRDNFGEMWNILEA